MGSETREVVRTLPLPAGLTRSADQFKIVTSKLKEYYEPKVNVTYEKAVLHEMKRKKGEKFEEFLTRLRLQADRCGYDVVTRESVVLECAVARCRDPELQKKLFSERQLTLQRAMEMAQHLELTRRQVEELNRPTAAHCLQVSSQSLPSSTSASTVRCCRCKQQPAPACVLSIQIPAVFWVRIGGSHL